MAVRLSTRCAACRSVNLPEIDRRLLGGDSTRKVSLWLKSLGEKISKDGLNNHKREHVGVSEEIKARVAEVEAVRESAAEAGFNRIQVLEQNVQVLVKLRDAVAERILKDLDSNTVDLDGNPTGGDTSRAKASLVTGAATEIRQSVVALQHALGEVKNEIDLNLNIPSDPAPIRAEIEQLLAERERDDGLHASEGK